MWHARLCRLPDITVMMVTAFEVEAVALGGGFSRLNLGLSWKSLFCSGASWYLDTKAYDLHASLVKSAYLRYEAMYTVMTSYLNIKMHRATSV